MPPRPLNEQGELRRVGFELEFAGLTLAEITAIIMDLFGGRAQIDNRFRHHVQGTRYGDFVVEVDSSLLTDGKYLEVLRGVGIEPDGRGLQSLLEDALEAVATPIVPFEIVTPPVPLDQLDALEQLREALRTHRAEGTHASIFYAFGLHINPEVPARDPATLVSFLRAFFLLFDWILADSEIDLTRRITPFVDEFPEEYLRLVIDPAYHPGIDRLIDDYLAQNPTRNRALDMIPIFATLRRERVERGVEEPELVKARPAFHYRLPNCRVDEPAWTIAQEWNRWVCVERLADDEDQLREIGEAYLLESQQSALDQWINRVTEWLERI